MSKMLSSIFGASPKIEVCFEAGVQMMRKYHVRVGNRKHNHVCSHLSDIYVPVYRNKDSVAGFVDVILPEDVAQLSYQSINCYLIGQVLCPQLGKDVIVMSRHITLAPEPGVLHESTRWDFKFPNVLMERESFYGTVVEFRYFIRVEVVRGGFLGTTLSVEEDIYVRNSTPPLEPKELKLEVGVEDALQLQFTYASSTLHCKSRIKGYVDFKMNLIKIRQMQMQIIRRELVATGFEAEPALVSTSTIGKFQIMDGDPVKGERIPIVIYMGSMPELTPTIQSKQFTVKYYLNLVLIDVDGRRYFKSCEIILWRK